jgi:hypothetical protein
LFQGVTVLFIAVIVFETIADKVNSGRGGLKLALTAFLFCRRTKISSQVDSYTTGEKCFSKFLSVEMPWFFREWLINSFFLFCFKIKVPKTGKIMLAKAKGNCIYATLYNGFICGVGHTAFHT